MSAKQTRKAQARSRGGSNSSKYLPGEQIVRFHSYEGILPVHEHEVSLVTLSGVPGSGKSCWGREFARVNAWSFVNADDVRRRIGVGDAGDQSKNAEIFTALCVEVRERLACGESVIADSTGLLLDVRGHLRAAAEIDGKDVGLHLAFFDNPSQAERRNGRRRGEHHVGVAAWRIFREALEVSKGDLRAGEWQYYHSLLFVEKTSGSVTEGRLVVGRPS